MKTYHFARYAGVAAGLILSGCAAGALAPGEAEALMAKRAEQCAKKQSGGGKCAVLWDAASGEPVPPNIAPLLLRR